MGAEWRLGRNRGRWIVRIGQSRYRTQFPDTEANRHKAEAAAAKIAQEHVEHYTGGTIDDLFGVFLEDAKQRSRPILDPVRVEYARKALSPTFGSLTSYSVTRETCRVYIARRRTEGVSDGTIRRELGTLRTVLNWKDPTGPQQFELPPSPDPKDRYLTREEVMAVLNHASLHVALFINLALTSGARREAILSLMWEDVAPDLSWFDLRRKEGGKGRATRIPTTNAARYALALTAALWGTEGHVVTYREKPVRSLKKGLIKAFEAAGVDHGGQPHHVFRHTAGVWMASAGVSMEEIADRLGHTDIRTTRKHYARFSPEAMRASTSALEL